VDATEHAGMVEKQLDAMIQRRSRKDDVDPDEREELWQASVRAYEEKRRHRAVLESLIAFHEEQAAKSLNTQQEGAA
jgi:hypothetical protein